MKLVQLCPGFHGEVLILFEGLIFFHWKPKTFDAVKDAVLAFVGSLYLVYVILLICLYVSYLLQDFPVVDWAVASNKQCDLCDVEQRVSSLLMGKC